VHRNPKTDVPGQSDDRMGNARGTKPSGVIRELLTIRRVSTGLSTKGCIADQVE
jgi:hypothetical protein